MAVIAISPRDATFERVASLTGIARLVLDLRIVTGLFATAWLALTPQIDTWELAVTTLGMAWLLLVLLRWSTVGWVVCTHPVVLALDALLWFVVLGATRPVSPVLLLVGAGALFAGVCLDRRGARFFSPLYVAGWWLVFSRNPPERAGAADILFDLLLVPAILVGTLFFGAGIRAVVLRGADAERRLRAEIRSAGIAEERARMAREMHDSLTKSMYGLGMLADALPAWIERSPEDAADQARQLAQLIRNAGQESRAMILAMRRTDARATPADQVASTVQRWRTVTGRDAGLELSGDPRLPTESAYELVAILGEALENVRRHTPDETPVHVRLEQQDAWVELVVRDSGPGIESPLPVGVEGHFGVLGMRERAARVGGQLAIVSTPGQGTVVTARLPASLDEDREVERAVGGRLVRGEVR
jgi:signal transduction histidine kinase